MEASGYSSKTPQKGSCPYAPLDEVLRYVGARRCRQICPCQNWSPLRQLHSNLFENVSVLESPLFGHPKVVVVCDLSVQHVFVVLHGAIDLLLSRFVRRLVRDLSWRAPLVDLTRQREERQIHVHALL